MSFLRHPEIFPSAGGAGLAANAPAHRLHEFPAGYSWAGCAPAEPASASPAGLQYVVMSSCRSRSFQRTAYCVLTVCVSPGGKFNEILRPFLVPKITGLENEPTEAMAIVARWKNRRITLDGSAAIANAIFVQLEREFNAEASYDDIKTQLLADEIELFKLLGIEEDLG